MSEAIGGYRELDLWQKAMTLTLEVYDFTAQFPDSEKFGLVAQMRRCAVSVPSNIAEGWGNHTTGSLLRYTRIARGSISELETQLTLALELGYAETSAASDLRERLHAVARMARGFEQYLEEKA